MVLRIPALTDYDLQLSQRYAEYITMLRSGHFLNSRNEVVYAGAWNPRTVSWPLLHLAVLAVAYGLLARLALRRFTSV